MKKFNQFVSTVVSTCMVLSCFSMPAFATEQSAEEVNTQGEAVYQIMNPETQEITTTYQSDIEAGHWNVDALGEDSPVVFEAFPMRSLSSVSDYAELTVTFEYLKSLSANDSARLTVTDRQTNEEYLCADLADSRFVELINLPIGNTYTVTLTETFDGETATYTRIMETKYTQASMPANVTLSGRTGTEGVQAQIVEVVAMNPTDAATEIREDGKEVTLLAPRESATMTPEELPAYYRSLPADGLYKVFASSGEDGAKVFSGFISTYAGGSEQGIFVPGFTLSTEESYNNAGISAFSLNGARTGAASTYFTSSEIKNNANNYTNMYDAEIIIDEDDTFGAFVVKFPCEAYTDYLIELTGSTTVFMEVWSAEDDDSTPIYEWSEDDGETSISVDYETAEADQYLYFGIYYAGAESLNALFRIKATEYTDQSNSYTDLKAAGTRCPCGITTTEHIDYRGDVDVYYLNNASESGNYVIEINADSENSNYLKVELLREGNGLNNTTIMVKDYSDSLTQGNSKILLQNLNAGTNYFVQVYSYYFSTNSTGDEYDIAVTSPSTPDPREGTTGNNTIATATALTGEDYLTDVYLHKNDVDYYSLTVTGEAKVLLSNISQQNGYLYNLSLRDSSGAVIATGAPNSTGIKSYMDDVLLQPGTYYVKVDKEGMATDAYSLYGSYNLEVEVLAPTVTVRSAVTLNYDAGGTNDIEGYMDTVLASSRCKVGSYTYPAVYAIDYADLYIMNGTNKLELNATNLATLPNGTHTVILEFFGVEATGQTITLTVTGSSVSSGTIVELPTMTMVTATNPNWYWAACAKMIADSRLVREGSSASTLTIPAAINAAFGTTYLTQVGTLAETAQLACYFYCGNKDSYNFINSAISMTGIENTILSELTAGKAILAQLTDSTDASVKYIVIYGINTGTHQYKIMDPEGSINTWVDAEELYSGYGGNTNLTFDGQVIECL